MSVYLVDYENVSVLGVDGVKDLKASDKVYIFYGENIKTIPFDKSIELVKSKAQIEFIETKKVGKNYLDFQLATYLGYLIGNGEKGNVRIISKDTGFDSIVDFWKARNINICRKSSIKGDEAISIEQVVKKKTVSTTQVTNKTVPEQYRKKIRQAIKKEKLAPSSYTIIYKAIEESKNKLQLNNTLVKSFESTKGGRIYNDIKDIFEEYKG